jgi:hypothetical protein
VPEATITAIRDKHSRGLPPEDAQIVDFTRDLIRRHRVNAATMAALQKRFGNFQMVELTGTIGYYSLLAMTANACELEPGAGAEVLQMKQAATKRKQKKKPLRRVAKKAGKKGRTRGRREKSRN